MAALPLPVFCTCTPVKAPKWLARMSGAARVAPAFASVNPAYSSWEAPCRSITTATTSPAPMTRRTPENTLAVIPGSSAWSMLIDADGLIFLVVSVVRGVPVSGSVQLQVRVTSTSWLLVFWTTTSVSRPKLSLASSGRLYWAAPWSKPDDDDNERPRRPTWLTPAEIGTPELTGAILTEQNE